MRYQFVFLLIFITACKSAPRAQNRQLPLNTDSTLLAAYQQHAYPALQTFLDSWAAEMPAVTTAQLDRLPEAEKQVYDIFKAFYHPENINSMGGSEWGDSLYDHVRYYILQDDIDYTVAGKEYTLHHFRPRLDNDSLKTLVLTARYDTMLNRFLGNEHSSLGEGSIMSPAAAQKESALRQQFLQHFVMIWYGHWGGYWQLYSYPVINRITFDNSFSSATASFTMVYEGGEARFVREKMQWRLVSAQRTWIE